MLGLNRTAFGRGSQLRFRSRAGCEVSVCAARMLGIFRISGQVVGDDELRVAAVGAPSAARPLRSEWQRDGLTNSAAAAKRSQPPGAPPPPAAPTVERDKSRWLNKPAVS